MKKILVTGSTGCLGRNLLHALNGKEECSILASGISIDDIPDLPCIDRILDDELFRLESLSVDAVINCAFARGNNVRNLVSALLFNERLIQKLKKFDIGSIINISSQGIYKSRLPGDLATEDAEIEPGEMYAMAKFSQERLFTSNFGAKVTNVRMASLGSNAGFLLHFIDNVKEGKDIVVTAPSQHVSILDVRDAVGGIIAILDIPNNIRRSVYNLGSGKQYSILQIAEMTKDIGARRGYCDTVVRVEDNGKTSAAGVDPSRLKQDSGWICKFDVCDIIESLF